MMNITERAKHELQKITEKRSDTRFKKVIGCLIYNRLIQSSNYKAIDIRIKLEDALWAGEVEPRILELIPALVLKKPKIFYSLKTMPEDLKNLIKEIRRGNYRSDFKNIPAKSYMQWIELIGHKGKKPSLLKTYRFTQDDLGIINRLKERMNLSEIDILRVALRNLDH